MRGQITIFLILGIILLVGVLIILFIASQGFGTDYNPFTFSREAIRGYVTDCVKTTADDALYKIGIQGMYYTNLPDPVYTTAESKTNHYNSEPSQEIVRTQLEKAIEDNIHTCIQDFEAFTKNGIEVQAGEPKAEVTINNQNLQIMLDYRVTATKASKMITINSFNTIKDNIRIPYLLEAMEQIIQREDIHLTELDNLGCDVTITPFEDKLIYLLEDPESIVLHQPYMVRFAK